MDPAASRITLRETLQRRHPSRSRAPVRTAGDRPGRSAGEGPRRRASGAVPPWPSAVCSCPPGRAAGHAAAVRDPEPEVRQMAAFALGLIGRQDAHRRPADGACRSVADRARPGRRSARAHRRHRAAPRRSGRWSGLLSRPARIANVFRRRERLPAGARSRGRAARALRADASQGLRPAGRRGAGQLRSAGVAVVASRLRVSAESRTRAPFLRFDASSRATAPTRRGFAARGLGAREGPRVPRPAPHDDGRRRAHAGAWRSKRFARWVRLATRTPLARSSISSSIRGIHPGIRAEAVTAIGKLQDTRRASTCCSSWCPIPVRPSAPRRSARSRDADPERFICVAVRPRGATSSGRCARPSRRALSSCLPSRPAPLLESMAARQGSARHPGRARRARRGEDASGGRDRAREDEGRGSGRAAARRRGRSAS